MKAFKKHTVSVYRYNPENLKEIIDIVKFEIKYIPTKKWNIFLIYVNDVFVGNQISIDSIVYKQEAIRPIIADSIRKYINGEDWSTNLNRKKCSFPNLEIAKMTEFAFNKKILNINKFNSKDELTQYNLIL